MRTAILIAATAAALALAGCNRSDDAAATDATTEAAEASGAAADTAAMAGDSSGGASAVGGANAAAGTNRGAGSTSGETMAPATGSTVTDGAMAPAAQPGATAGNNVTETERRLNPPAAPQ